MKTLLCSLTALFLLCFNLSVVADEAEQHRINPGKVLGVVVGDWNKDGGMDRAILVAPDNEDHDVGLYIYLQDDANNSQLEIFKPNLVWTGIMWGNTPSLGVTSTGSLQVLSQNQAIGRNRWSQKLTIAFRNNHFVVAGYTYESYDTLDVNSEMTCDVNLLTGKGFVNKKAFRTQQVNIKLADWSDQSVPKECRQE